MVYVINPNGKDVWLRDNADTMDISPATDASSVYLENGRSVEQELSGTLKSEVVTVDSAMEKIVEGTLDGAYQECVLKGQTLVNLTSDKRVMGTSYVRFDVNNEIAKPNTLYTVVVHGQSNIKQITCVDTNGVNPYFNIVSPKHWNTFTTPSELTSHHIRVYSSTTIDEDFINSINVLLLEGDYTNVDIPYFEGMQSVKIPVLTTTGKNLFDVNGNKELSCFYSATVNGKLTPHTDVDTYTIKIKPNTTYTLSCIGKTMSHITYWDDSLSYVSSEADYSDANLKHITTPSKANYVKFPIHKQGISEIQIEEGTQATTYEPYKSNILSTPQDMTLHKVNNICDTYKAITGEYTQCIGERVYQVGDEANANVITDMTKTLYVLDNPITTIVEPNIIPFAYENGSVSLDSANGILPTLEYATTISRMGQVSSNGLIIRKQEQQITNLEKMLIQGIVNMNYNNALLNLDLKL